MANRFEFHSVGASAGDAMRKYLLEREMQRRYEATEARAAEELKMRQAADARAAESQKSALAAAELQRRAIEANLGRMERQEALADVEAAGVGGELSDEQAARARRLIPSMVSVGPEQAVQGAQTGEDAEGVPQYDVTMAPGKVTSKGTRKQQFMQQLRDNPEMTDRDVMLALMDAGEENVSAAEAAMLSQMPKDVRAFRRTDKGDLEESIAGKGWVTHTGALPEKSKYQIINEPIPGAGANGGTPFVLQIPTAFGTELRSGRTGAPVTGPDGKPIVLPNKESSAQTIARVDNAAAQASAEVLLEDFDTNPDWTGPVAGRLESMQAAYLGNDKEFARFEARTNSLKNRFIKAITGAQMSEAEAVRIMKQLPDVNLPPATFRARLEVMLEELDRVRELQQQVFTSVRKPADNPVTEKRLGELFPDSHVSEGKTTSGSTPAPGAKAQDGGNPFTVTKSGARIRVKPQ